MSLTIEQQLDYSFFRLPYEVIVKKFKENRKILEKQFASILSSLVKVDCQNAANQLLEQLHSLKSLIENQNRQMANYLSQLKFRVETGECSHEQKLQRGIVEYVLRQGYVSTAQKLIESYKIEDFCQIEQEIIVEANAVIKDLKNKQLKLALQWCKANHNRLLKEGSLFYNNLLFQSFIMRYKVGIKEGLAFLRQNSHQMQQETIQRAMGCILLQNELANHPKYENYLSNDAWWDLIAEFKKEIYNLYCLQRESSLLSAFKCGISTLKTSYCDQKQYQNPFKCPICNAQIQKLSKELLMTQKLGSTWICRISDELMDENNPPMMLPNKQVYSQKSLQTMAERQNGIVVCPITKQEFKYSDCIRVYLT